MAQWQQSEVIIRSEGRSIIEVGHHVQAKVEESAIQIGLCHVFLLHTSASLILCENADPTVLTDLEMIMQRLAPDGDPAYQHNYEGDDDMAAHVRSVLTTNDVSLPIGNGRLKLGTWQGLFLFEHRYQPHRRRLVVTITGN